MPPSCPSRSSSNLSFPFPYRKLHSGMKTYGCELCGKRFLDSLRLRMHLLAHSGRRGPPDRPPLSSGQGSPFLLPRPLLRARTSPCRPAGGLVCLSPPWALLPGGWSRRPVLAVRLSARTHPRACLCDVPSREDCGFISKTVVELGSRCLMNLTIGFTLSRRL